MFDNINISKQMMSNEIILKAKFLNWSINDCVDPKTTSAYKWLNKINRERLCTSMKMTSYYYYYCWLVDNDVIASNHMTRMTNEASQSTNGGWGWGFHFSCARQRYSCLTSVAPGFVLLVSVHLLDDGHSQLHMWHGDTVTCNMWHSDIISSWMTM